MLAELSDQLINSPQIVGTFAMFYAFATVLLFAAVMVITARNPVHSVLFLILGFFNAAGLFLLMGAEFLAAILVIVYVGAVAVLFLFVVMMLDIDFAELRKGAARNLPVGLVTAGILAAEMIMLVLSWSMANGADSQIASRTPVETANTEALGQILYTQYVIPFQVAGLILLVAMIGAIVLTHRTRPGVRRQLVATQNSRNPADVMKLTRPETGEGI